jgi:Zn-dependent protease
MVDYVSYEEPKGPKLFRFGKYSFSTIELKHLSIALIAITGTLMAFNSGNLNQFGIVTFIILNFLTIGLGFLLHEIGHKLVAQYYGFISEFRADFPMLAIAFLLALFSPIIFLAPGAVMIHGRLSRKQNGIISVAGPLVNLALAFIFVLLAFVISPSGNSVLGYLIWLGIWVNSFLGFFNMLPIWVLDGKKVLAWNKGIYFSVMGILVLLLYLSFTGFFV